MASTNEHHIPPDPTTGLSLQEWSEDELGGGIKVSTIDKAPSMPDSSQIPDKKRARRTTSNSEPRKRVKGRQGALKGLMNLPIETFTQIAYQLAPADLVTLLWSNKFFRSLLLHQSAAKMWQWAESNVPGLPPCPVGMSEPQYAVLVFTKYCTLCGASATARLDPFLHARLCASCRNDKLKELESWKMPKLVDRNLIAHSQCTGMKLKGTSRHRSYHPYFGLQPEIDEVLNKRQQFQDAGDARGLAKWEEDRRKLVEDRQKHGDQLRIYLDSMNKSRAEELEEMEQQRRDAITERIKALGWTDKDLKMGFFGFAEWRSLTDTPKPLTERIWQNLLPKLVPLLEENRRQETAYDTRGRRTQRRHCVDQFILQKIHIKHPIEEVIKTLRLDLPADTPASGETDPLHDYRVQTMLPNSYFALTWDSLVDLGEREITLDKVNAELKAREGDLRGQIVEWRDRVEQELVGKIVVERGKMNKDVAVTIKGSTECDSQLSPDQRLLLRADTVFKFTQPDPKHRRYWQFESKDENKPFYYPKIITDLYDYFSEYTPRSEPEREPAPAQDVDLRGFERNVKVESIVKQLLRDLDMPDATRIELLAAQSRFICGRCIDYTLRTWDEIINHYINAPRHWEIMKDKGPIYPVRHPIVYHNVHDLDFVDQPKPLLRLLANDEARTIRNEGYFQKPESPACFLCRMTGRSYQRLRTGLDVVSHMQDVHKVLNTVEGIHYGRVDVFVAGEWSGRWDKFHDAQAAEAQS